MMFDWSARIVENSTAMTPAIFRFAMLAQTTNFLIVVFVGEGKRGRRLPLPGPIIFKKVLDISRNA
jgi:hypothetical protein